MHLRHLISRQAAHALPTFIMCLYHSQCDPAIRQYRLYMKKGLPDVLPKKCLQIGQGALMPQDPTKTGSIVKYGTSAQSLTLSTSGSAEVRDTASSPNLLM